MNTLLVATDFSAAADNAALYAAQLAQRLSCSLQLLHVYEMPVSMSDVPVMMISAEELKHNADRGLRRVKELLLKNYEGLEVAVESRLGDVASETEDYCSTQRPLMVVAGKHNAAGIERFLFGSSTLSIIRHAPVPVLAVPPSQSQCAIRNIALAVDDPAIEKHQPFLQKLTQSLGAQLHLVHVKQHRDDAVQIEGLLQQLHPQQHLVTNEDFVEGMETFLQTHAVDLLIIMPHEHSWMERVFFKTHTAELLQKIRIPILSLPEKN